MIIHKGKKALLFKLRSPERITTVVPSAKTLKNNVVALPHRPDETRVLRNLGFEVPDPMPLHYNWPKVNGVHMPFAQQVTTASFLTMHDRVFCLNDMGAGKTICTLWAFDYLRSIKAAKRMLVVCPMSTMERTWGDSIFMTFPGMTFNVLHGSREKRLKMLDEKADVYIINVDAVGIITKALADRPDINVIAIDELAAARNAGTNRWKFLDQICNKQTPRKVWGITGAPTPNAPTDAWAQCRLVTPTNPRVPRYFGRFKDQVMRQLGPFKWVPRDNAVSTVFECMQPAIRFSLDECTALPEQVVLTRDVELTKEQVAAYKSMASRLAAEVEGGQILAVNEAVKAGKLVQIACGVAYGADGGNIVIPAGPRTDVVKELIESSEGKVIVFVPLTGALTQVAAELAKMFDDTSAVEIVHGETSKTERDRIFAQFQQGPTRVLVANAAAMSHGLTLTAATTIVWYAPINSNDVYQQACARVRRPGQTKKTRIVHLQGTEIERRMYKRLINKQSMQGILLEMVRESRDETTQGAQM